MFLNGFLTQLKTDNLLTDKLVDLIIDEYSIFEVSVSDGDLSTIGYLTDFIKRLLWIRNDLEPTIEQAKRYTQSRYNGNPLGMRGYRNARELMTEYLKNTIKRFSPPPPTLC